MTKLLLAVPFIILIIWHLPHTLDPDSVTIVQLHIPRTGGTHLSAHLMYELEARHYYKCNRFSKPGDCSSIRPGIRAITRLVGWECNNHHSNLTQLRACVPQLIGCNQTRGRNRVVWVTMLRDPVQRLNSVYAKCINNRLCWDTFTAKQLSTAKLNFTTAEGTQYFSFAEWLNHPDVLRNIRPGRTYACALVPDCDDPKYDDPEKLISDSLKELARFDFIGITERHDESVRQLAKLFSAQRLPEPSVLRFRESTASYLTPELVAAIEKISAIDLAIYRTALAHYENLHSV